MAPMTVTYDDLLARVRGLVANTSRVPVVGISGHGGSGTGQGAGEDSGTVSRMPGTTMPPRSPTVSEP